MKNRDILESTESLSTLADAKMPGSAGFIVAYNLKQVQAHLETLDKARKEIIDRYTQKDAEGKPVPVTDAEGKVQEGQVLITDRQAFTAELKDLLDLEVGDVVRIKTIKAEALDKVEIEPRHLVPLFWMFE